MIPNRNRFCFNVYSCFYFFASGEKLNGIEYFKRERENEKIRRQIKKKNNKAESDVKTYKANT